MDSLLTAAARALAAGDALGALKRVALRDDPGALAMRGIAMAQLGDLSRAADLLRRAERAFGPRETLARARCAVARAEVALAARDLARVRTLGAARRTLEAHGDRVNALHARLLEARRSLLLGRVDDAARELEGLDLEGAPPMLAAVGQLCVADVARRRLRSREAQEALVLARDAAVRAGIPALATEVEGALAALELPVARAISGAGERPLGLEEVERLLEADALVVDGCRRVVRAGGSEIALASRPVLFALARTLARAPGGGASRDALIADAFGARRPNESHRARLRVEIGRLRRALAPLAEIHATAGGFALLPRDGRAVTVLLPPIEGAPGALLALLGDGQAWSTSALAMALGRGQRTVQRALGALEEAGQVRSFGRARARRWLAPPVAGFATTLLLPGAVPGA